MVEVTVEAKWRTSRLEVWSPYNGSPTVTGYCEILMQSSGAPSPALKGAGMAMAAPKEGEPITYGALPAASVSRSATAEVLAETVHVQGIDISLETVMLALQAFVEKWRLEDADKPLPSMLPPPMPPNPPPLDPKMVPPPVSMGLT